LNNDIRQLIQLAQAGDSEAFHQLVALHDGKIELRLPSDFPATIDVTVVNRRSTGAIDSEFPLQITLDDDDVLANGIINGGKFSVKLKTSHDSITIEKD
jgi:hypothetical protein|tara:strand:- start:34230 stop:34526 length:297 start_codon:yes stop_codon:yes gene_type:complete